MTPPKRYVPQIEHFLQAPEAIRRDGRPEWMQVVGLTHNPGKLLSFSGPSARALAGCGLDNVMLSWGHGKYLYHAFRGQGSLSEEGLAMIRYHSFIRTWHREGACIHLMDSRDYKHLEAVRAFNPYDLYSKSNERVRVAELKPYYENLVAKFVLDEIDW
ncbi:hypothetical protein BS47DRAFT_1373279 [Hydnum rufescens UP504]|uniref:Inositol oxygenase n=1 Tax=Hydnum rufescens UP504 TaxID=1448309 RepID=A0A9P6DUL0_9AGAM|nr:hypothetical protein BS47DRAFT_1373279 [Hydnum rufescens UP504]